MKTLKSLSIYRFTEITISDIVDICKHLEELSELALQYTKVMMFGSDLLEIVKLAPKLQLLQYLEIRPKRCEKCVKITKKKEINEDQRKRIEANRKIVEDWRKENGLTVGPPAKRIKAQQLPSQRCIDDYMKIVQTVGQRREKTHLLIRVRDNHPLLAHVPALKDLIKKHSDTMALEMALRWDERIAFDEIDMPWRCCATCDPIFRQ